MMSDKKTGEAVSDRKSITLYNVIFPLWVAIFYTPFFLFIIGPLNFLINCEILRKVLDKFEVLDNAVVFKKNIVKLWGYGLWANCIGAAILIASAYVKNEWFAEYIGDNRLFDNIVIFNPWDNWFSVLYILMTVMVAGYFIFRFVRNNLFLEVDISVEKRRKLAMVLALSMAPYSMLVPPDIMTFRQVWYIESAYFSNHIVENIDERMVVETNNVIPSESIISNPYKDNIGRWINNEASKISDLSTKLFLDEADYIIRVFNKYDDEKEIYLFFITENEAVFCYEDKWYGLNEEISIRLNDDLGYLTDTVNDEAWRRNVSDEIRL